MYGTRMSVARHLNTGPRNMSCHDEPFKMIMAGASKGPADL